MKKKRRHLAMRRFACFCFLLGYCAVKLKACVEADEVPPR